MNLLKVDFNVLMIIYCNHIVFTLFQNVSMYSATISSFSKYISKSTWNTGSLNTSKESSELLEIEIELEI
jgi:hypothetical protein